MAVVSDLESKIIRQIEYYFGDHNLSRDRFLQEEIKKDEGWISLAGRDQGFAPVGEGFKEFNALL